MNNTTYYPAELMVYFEKHRFLEVIKSLLIRLAIDRPHCLRHYVRVNLREIANSVWTNTVIVLLSHETNLEELAKSIENTFGYPIIIFNPKSQSTKFRNNLRHFEKLSKKYGISNKILLNYPRNYKDILRVQECRIIPNILIDITGNDPCAMENFSQVIEFYKNIMIRVTPANCRCPQSLATQILYNIKFSPLSMSREIGFSFVYRIVIFGRRGSGRNTLAKLLAARYNLVIVDAESLIEQTLQSKNNMAKVLCVSYDNQKEFTSSAITSLIWKRLLEPDTLARGWIVINFPKCLSELEILMGKFQTPPNRFVVLHCTRTIALKRLVKHWEKDFIEYKSKNTIMHAEQEFSYYDKNIEDIYSFLKTTKVNTVHVDAREPCSAVKKKVFALLERGY